MEALTTGSIPVLIIGSIINENAVEIFASVKNTPKYHVTQTCI
jgi:hypothetical protein